MTDGDGRRSIVTATLDMSIWDELIQTAEAMVESGDLTIDEAATTLAGFATITFS